MQSSRNLQRLSLRPFSTLLMRADLPDPDDLLSASQDTGAEPAVVESLARPPAEIFHFGPQLTAVRGKAGGMQQITTGMPSCKRSIWPPIAGLVMRFVSSIEAGSTGGFARPLVDQLVGFDTHGGVNNAASRSREGSIDVDRWREAAR